MVQSVLFQRIRRVVRVPDTIDDTGSTDVLAELQAFFDSTSHNDIVVLGKNKNYRISHTLLLRGNRDWTLDGNGSRIFLTGRGEGERTRGTMRITGGAYGATITSLKLEGGKPVNEGYVKSIEAQHGLDILEPGATIEDCEFLNVFGDFVNFASGASSGIVRGCYGNRSGRQGMSITDGVDYCLEDNELRNVSRTCFDIEPGTTSGRYIGSMVVRRNSIYGPFGGNFVSAAAVAEVDDVWIEDNIVYNEEIGIRTSSNTQQMSRRWHILRNQGTKAASGSTVMRVHMTDSFEIRDNIQPMNPNRPAPHFFVFFQGVHDDFDVRNNHIPGATGWPNGGQWYIEPPSGQPMWPRPLTTYDHGQ